MGTPEFETVVEPLWPQGIPTAGRESTGGAGVVRGDEGGLVINGVTASGDGVLVGRQVAAGDGDGVLVGSVVGLGAGALMAGGTMAVAGAAGAGGIVVTEDGVSTLVGVSRNPEAERRAMTISSPTSTTIMVVSMNAALSCSRRRRDVSGVSSVVAPDTAGTADAMTSPISARGRTSVGAMASSASTSRGASAGGWVGAVVSVLPFRGAGVAGGRSGTGDGAGRVTTLGVPASRRSECLRQFASSALAKS
jgi:hypothetical protein